MHRRDQEAERLATTIDLNWVRRARGEYLPLASSEEAAAYPHSPVDRECIKADELMVTTMIHDHAARRHCYELLVQAFALGGT